MRLGGLETATAICLVLAAYKSFVDSAPIDSQERKLGSVHEDSDVEQLQTLKHSIGSTLAVMKAQAAAVASHSNLSQPEGSGSDVASELAVHESKPKLDKDPQNVAPTTAPRPLPPSLVPKGQAEVVHGEHQRQNTPAPVPPPAPAPAPASMETASAPSEQLTENGERRSYVSRDLSNAMKRMDKLAAYASVQYSPLDMAEYVFWTGDEKGVTLAVEEFLQEGLMTREEAIAFLQEVKYNLDYLQAHYTQGKEKSNSVQRAFEKAERQQNRALSKEYQDMMEPLKKRPVLDPLNDMTSNGLRQDAIGDLGAGILPEDADYEELLERLRVADFLYTEYSLEEVIYQLAKVMFSQSLTRGSAQAQETLQKFTSFLEAEAAQGRISRALEKKVLDVLIAALSDTLTEHPELVSAAREGLGGPASPTSGHILQDFLLSRVPVARSRETASLGLNKYIHDA